MTIGLDELHRAIKRGDVVAVRAYIAGGGSVSTPDGQGWTPLRAAAYEGHTAIVHLLLDAGADANEDAGPGSVTPLELAAMADSLPAVELLLQRGARTEHGGVSVVQRLRTSRHGDRPRILEAIQRAHKATRSRNRHQSGAMTFLGTVQFRSSSPNLPAGAPQGETEIQRLNPNRTARILAVTGWRRLEAGSLNLTVDDSVLGLLEQHEPTLVKSGTEILYPPPFEGIPMLRRAYWYYLGRAESRGRTTTVLIRRAQVPVRGRVELFAPERIIDELGINEGDSVTVSVLAERVQPRPPRSNIA